MRKRLMAAAAMAPLMLGYSAAYAQTTSIDTISSGTSTPVATATAVSGGPGDVDVDTGGAITLNNNAAPAITLNSDNNVYVAGAISTKNINNVTGILITGNSGQTSNIVSNTGTINLTEDYTAPTNNDNGITQAPFASPSSTNRIAIRQTGAFTGLIENDSVINIQGNNSVGISIENTLTGPALAAAGTGAFSGGQDGAALSQSSGGSITVTGNNNYGIHIANTATVFGNVLIEGTITAKGQGSVGFQSDAPITGALGIYGTISSTGYAVEVRETGSLLTSIENTAADIEQGGSAVVINGSVGGGVILGAPQSAVASTDLTTDTDGDGILDSQEGTSSLITYGSAPALQIGGTNSITLGNFSSTASDWSYGLVIEGTVSGQGLLDGVSATGVNIGGSGGATVNLSNGIKVTSTANVNAVAYEANATAMHLGAGVSGITLENDGVIAASVTASGAVTATALQIDAGAYLPNITNNGTLSATTSGDAANGSVIIDKSGTVSSVYNTGQIEALLNSTGPGEPITGRGIAMDLSANTTGVTLTQIAQSGAATQPLINGDVLLGNGQNTVNLLNGTMVGQLSFGNASGDSFTIDSEASYTGALTYGGDSLAVNLKNGTLQDNSPTTIKASSLYVGPTSTLTVALDPANNRATLFDVSGAATIASGAKIGATVLSTPSLTTGATFTIIQSPQLSLGSVDSSLLGNLPYMFNGSLSSNANSVSISIQTKTPAQMNLNKAETAAFNAIYQALPQDAAAAGSGPSIQTAIIGAANRSSFIGAYDQLLPSSSGDVFQTVFGMSKSVSRAASERFDTSSDQVDEDEDDFVVSGFWASEFYSGMDQNKVDNNAYHSAALGIIGGYDFGGTGFTFSGGSSNITRPGGTPGDTLDAVSSLEGGLYASPRFGALSIDARVSAGWLHATDRREFVASVISGDQSETTTVARSVKGSWSGYDLGAHLGAGLEFDVTKHLFFEPKVYADVFHMHEDAYDEHGDALAMAGYAFDVSARDSTQTNGTVSLVTGLHLGNQFVFTPQIELGYDKVVSGGPGDTTARFAYGGPSFTVPANQIDGAAMARLSLRGDGNYVHFALEGGGEYSSNYRDLDLKAIFRLTF